MGGSLGHATGNQRMPYPAPLLITWTLQLYGKEPYPRIRSSSSLSIRSESCASRFAILLGYTQACHGSVTLPRKLLVPERTHLLGSPIIGTPAWIPCSAHFARKGGVAGRSVSSMKSITSLGEVLSLFLSPLLLVPRSLTAVLEHIQGGVQT